MTQRCECEHWQQCPTCTPDGFDAAGNRKPPFELRWERPRGTHQIGFHDKRGKARNKPTLGKREANATPLEFRDELLRLAMMARK